jgi:hypothetical protein
MVSPGRGTSRSRRGGSKLPAPEDLRSASIHPKIDLRPLYQVDTPRAARGAKCSHLFSGLPQPKGVTGNPTGDEADAVSVACAAHLESATSTAMDGGLVRPGSPRRAPSLRRRLWLLEHRGWLESGRNRRRHGLTPCFVIELPPPRRTAIRETCDSHGIRNEPSP